MAKIEHRDITGMNAVHPSAFISETDPADDIANNVAAGKVWIETDGSGNPVALWLRNTANDDWLPLVSTSVAAHATSHEDGGSDEIDVTGLSGVLDDPQMADVIIESSGPTALALDGIADGDYLRRSGSTIVGDTPAGGGGGALSYLGYNTVGGTAETITGNRVYMKKITVPSDGILISIGIYVESGSNTNGSFGVAAFSDNAGSPHRVLAALMNSVNNHVTLEAATSTPFARWLTMPLGLAVTAGDYWIGFSHSSAGVGKIYYDAGSDRHYDPGGTWFSDAGRTTVTTGSRAYSIRAAFLATA